MRDLKDEYLLDDRLSNAAWCANVYSCLVPGDGRPPTLWLEPQLVPLALAAGRRQMCQGCNAETVFVNVADLIFRIICKQISHLPHILDETIYELLGLICCFAKDVIVEEEGSDRLLHIVEWFVPLLPAQPLDLDDRRPQALAMRRFTHNFWREITIDLHQQRLALRHRGWRTFSVLWRRVGQAIPEGPEAVPNEAPFEPLARCAWHKCLCSVHEPKHRMRVCKGCWVVAYCGTKCQTDDWHAGGHREHCRSTRE
ncbi:hypothetical protein PsYK624_060190 [Phanerochaete sordida]|uniref:MYND-type domain-containing protein n=1 Tax=Phanerochaete sordida TaxID=48140 RepID=A0A9P3LDG5_9APHY|nr:hypothetical protein PsYK624_060190 [Phanerochaete sordida]